MACKFVVMVAGDWRSGSILCLGDTVLVLKICSSIFFPAKLLLKIHIMLRILHENRVQISGLGGK